MVEHQSKEIVDQMSEDLKAQPALALPRNINNSIQPVYVVNPVRFGLQANANRTVTGAGLLFTVPTDNRRYFLCSITLSTTFNGTCDSVKTFVRGDLINGTTAQELLSLVYNPGTVAANQLSIHKDFIAPVELTPGSTIDIVNAFAAGTQTTIASLVLIRIDKQ